MSEDLLNLCNGKHGKFDEDCEYFSPPEEYQLLREQEMRAVFEQGRCAPYEDLLKPAIRGQLAKYQDLLLLEDHLDALTFEIAERLKEQILEEGFNIYVMKACINTAAERGVHRLLSREKTGLFEEKTCKLCVYLSRSKPYLCERATITTPEGNERENLFYQEPRNLSERACEEGFEPYPDSPDLEDIEDSELVEDTKPEIVILLEDYRKRLAKRAEQEQRIKRKKICERQYIVFLNLIDKIEQGMSRREAIEAIAADLGVGINTVYLDIIKIKDFLEPG